MTPPRPGRRQTVLDLRRSPVLCKAHPNNTGQLMKHTFFKGRIWFSGIVSGAP